MIKEWNIVRSLCWIALILMTSCNVVYLPSLQNVPLLAKNGESTAAISTSNLQFSGAFNQQAGIQVNFQMAGFLADETVERTRPPNQWNLEIAPGLFKELSPGLVFEVYGGAGIGGSNVYQNDPFDRYHNNHYRLIVQPDLGYRGKKIEVALSTRLVRLEIFNQKYHNVDDDWLKDNDLIDLGKSPHFFVEPALTFRYNFAQEVQLFSQFIYSYKMTQPEISRHPATLIIGLSGRL